MFEAHEALLARSPSEAYRYSNILLERFVKHFNGLRGSMAEFVFFWLGS